MLKHERYERKNNIWSEDKSRYVVRLIDHSNVRCPFCCTRIRISILTNLSSLNRFEKKNVYNKKLRILVVEWLVGNGTTPSALEVNTVNQEKFLDGTVSHLLIFY